MDHFYLSKKRLDSNTFYTSKNTFIHQRNPNLVALHLAPQKQPQNTYFHPLHTPKITVIHTRTKTSSFFSFSSLSITRKRGKLQPSLLLQLFGQEVKFYWYNFLLDHFHILFYSIFIILVSSSCFHHPLRIIMHYCGFWLWQFRIWML